MGGKDRRDGIKGRTHEKRKEGRNEEGMEKGYGVTAGICCEKVAVLQPPHPSPLRSQWQLRSAGSCQFVVIPSCGYNPETLCEHAALLIVQQWAESTWRHTGKAVEDAGGDELLVSNGLQPSLLDGAGLIMQEAGRLCVNQLIASLGILQSASAF